MGNKYTGISADFIIKLHPTSASRGWGKSVRSHPFWYVEYWVDDKYLRNSLVLGAKGIISLLGKYGKSLSDFSWEIEKSDLIYSAPWTPQKEVENCIYFIHAIGTERIKIGWAAILSVRLYNLSCSSPFPLKVLCAIPGSRTDEAELHRRFDKIRVHNEWFLYTDELMEFIKSLKNSSLI